MNKLTKCLAALTACAGFSIIGVISGCSTDKKTESNTAVHEHTYDESHWEKNEIGHWYAANCGHIGRKSYELHKYDDDRDATCDVCGYEREIAEGAEPVTPTPTPEEPEPTEPNNPTPEEPEKPTEPTPTEPETPENPEEPITPTEPEKPTEPNNPTPEEPEKPTEPTEPEPTDPEPVIPDEPESNNLLLDSGKISGLGGNIAERTVICESGSGNIFIAPQTNFTLSAQATDPVTIDGKSYESAISAEYSGCDFESFCAIGFEITSPATVTAYISASEFTEVSLIDDTYFEEYEYVCEPQYIETACKITFTVTQSGTFYLNFLCSSESIVFNLHSLEIVF